MDRTLVERARDGDREAFASLAAASIDSAHAVASLILRDRDRANDAVQEALIGAWRGIRAIREPEAWNAWLHRLVIRSCYRLARHERRLVTQLPMPLPEEPGGPDSTTVVDDREQLERGFRRLPVDQRAILVLTHYIGMPPAEAAAVLGIPSGTARSRLHRATQAMRAALEADARPTAAVQEQLT